MSVDVRWDDPDQTILFYQFADPWTWAEYAEAADREWEMLDDAPDIVDTIVDLTRVRHLPEEDRKLLRFVAAHSHRKQGMLVLVGDENLTYAFGHLLTEYYPHSPRDLISVATLEQAYTALSAQYGVFEAPEPLRYLTPQMTR